jgi:hypothetical protein
VNCDVARSTADQPIRRAVGSTAIVSKIADAANEAELVKPEVAIPVSDLTKPEVPGAVADGKNVGEGVWVGCGVNVGEPEKVLVAVKLPEALKPSVPSAVRLPPNTEENARLLVAGTSDRSKIDDQQEMCDADNRPVDPQTVCLKDGVANTPDDAERTSVTGTHDDRDRNHDGDKTPLAVKPVERGRTADTAMRREAGSESDFAAMLDPRSVADPRNVPETVSELDAAKNGVFECDSVGDGDCVGVGHSVLKGVSDGVLLRVGEGDCDIVGDGDCDGDIVGDGDCDIVGDGDCDTVGNGDRVANGDLVAVREGDCDCVLEGD